MSGGQPDSFTRRTTLFGIALSALGVMFSTASFLDTVKKNREKGESDFAQAKELQDLFHTYLYPLVPGSAVKTNISLVPPMSDPWGPSGRRFSGSGTAVAAAYASALRPLRYDEIADDHITVGENDATVLIGSHLVNHVAEHYFGDKHSVKPIHKIHYSQNERGYKASLRWSIYTPQHAKVLRKRELFEGKPSIRIEPVHSIFDSVYNKTSTPRFEKQGDLYCQMDDYFLITALPRDNRFDRRVISLAGLHKPGTLAAEKLLKSGSFALDLLREIDNEVGGAPFFQALIALKVHHVDGLPYPAQMKLVKAEAIQDIV